MFSRDNIQGFIDGFVYAGGDPKSVGASLSEWIENHPTYKADSLEKTLIQSDLASYRVSVQKDIAPSKKPPVNP